MRWANVSLLSVLLASALSSADVRIPQPALPDPPPPAPMPSAVYTLGADDIYPVESDSPLVIRSYPKGLVEFQQMKPGTYFWKSEGKWVQKEFKGPHLYFGTATGKGRTEVEFFWAEDGAVKSKTALIDCLVGPQPPPDPKPDDPDPPTTKSPWDNAPGLRVLIVYPKRGNLPAEQQAIITGKRVRDYLDANTAKEGGQGAYWILKTDEDVSALPQSWQKAYGLATGDRWVVAGNGAKWTSEALPADPDKMLELLGRYR